MVQAHLKWYHFQIHYKTQITKFSAQRIPSQWMNTSNLSHSKWLSMAISRIHQHMFETKIKSNTKCVIATHTSPPKKTIILFKLKYSRILICCKQSVLFCVYLSRDLWSFCKLNRINQPSKVESNLSCWFFFCKSNYLFSWVRWIVDRFNSRLFTQHCFKWEIDFGAWLKVDKLYVETISELYELKNEIIILFKL